MKNHDVWVGEDNLDRTPFDSAEWMSCLVIASESLRALRGLAKRRQLNVSKNAVKQYISPSRPNNLPRYLFYCDPKIKQGVSRTFTLSLPKSFQ